MTADTNAFSPGPWIVRPDVRHPWRVECPCEGFEEYPDMNAPVCDVSYLPNAYLVAAAPELFAALQKLTNCIDNIRDDQTSDSIFGGQTTAERRANSVQYASLIAQQAALVSDLVDDARAALAKATGAL